MPRVLHVLSQRPGHTGSGTMLEALAREAGRAGWTQAAVVGVPAGSDDAAGLEALGVSVFPVTFASPAAAAPALGFPVPGMSDVMPYASTRFSELTDGQLALYRSVWTRHLERVARDFAPDVIHSNHVWLVSSFVKDAAPDVPVVTQCHATGLRQMEFCPHLRDAVVQGVRRNERFLTLHRAHAEELSRALDIGQERVTVVGAGYREDIFCPGGPVAFANGDPSILYAGKYSSAKGVPQLLDAFDRLAKERPSLALHVAGSGAGAEAEVLRERMERTPGVTLHGQVGQEELAALMRAADVFVLPSLYEGIPLVLIEALACGCRLVATSLPGVADEIAPRVGEALVSIPMPAIEGVDRLAPGAAPAFVDAIAAALASALESGAVRTAGSGRGLPDDLAASLRPYAWSSLFGRIAGVWAAAGGNP